MASARGLAGRYPLRTVCRLLSVPRSSALSPERPGRDLSRLLALVRTNLVTFPTFGYRRMYELVKRQQAMGTRSEMRAVYVHLGVLGRRAPPRVRTTDSRHEHPVHPNLVRDLAIVRPDQVWVADTTGLQVAGRTAYLALVEDAFTRRIVGYAVGFVNEAFLVLEALEAGLAKGRPEIHHSDQGRPYASGLYTRRLLALEPPARISMARAGCAYENGLAERLNRTVKEEEIRRSDYEDLHEARRSIASYIVLYNERRIHMALGFRTPQEVMKASAQD